jgi:hypothetical protein
MKSSPSRRGFLLAVLAGACLLPSVSSAAVTVIGSGPDSSFLVLQSPNLGLRTYEVHYTYNSGNQDGYFLLSQVLGSDTSVTSGLTNYGSTLAPNFFTDNFTFGSVTETSAPWGEPGPAWSHWVSGGHAGYPTAAPITSGTWVLSSGMSAPYRLIAPGSWDAYYFSDGVATPGVSPVPETSSVVLGVLSSLLLLKRRRC